jgi:aquaporin TIP
MDRVLVRKMVVEGVGALALSFVGVGAIIYGGAAGGLTTVALAHGFVIAVMVCACGHISGGHFNPAVTIGFLATKRIAVTDAIGYIVAQLGGAAIGALLVSLALPSNVANIEGGLTRLAPHVSVGSGLVIEFVLTFFLVWVIFGVAVDPRGSFAAVAGLPIGLTVTLDIMMGGPLTGASMNPSRTFGPDLVAGVWDNAWLYFVACPLGAIAAALLYEHLILAHRE